MAAFYPSLSYFCTSAHDRNIVKIHSIVMPGFTGIQYRSWGRVEDALSFLVLEMRTLHETSQAQMVAEPEAIKI
jgi:hypothetical protein